MHRPTALRPLAVTFAALVLTLVSCGEQAASVDPVCRLCHRDASCGYDVAGVRKCACKEGFVGDGFVCEASDPCGIDNGGCDPNAECTASGAERTCRCTSEWSGTGLVCIINSAGSGGWGACTQAAAICDPNATCLDAPDIEGNDCACNPGFSGDGDDCTAGGPCATGGGCNLALSSCVPVAGVATCICRPGYALVAGVCTAVENCYTDANCHADATCEGTPGSRRCVCAAGLEGNGKICGDQCSTTLACPEGAECIGEPGARGCVCTGGYVGNGYICTWGGGGCSGAFECPENATCGPSSQCQCKAGFVGTPPDCIPNPCLTDNGGCGSHSTCSASTGTAVCSCTAPYVKSTTTPTLCVRCNVDADCSNDDVCKNPKTAQASCEAPPSPCETGNGGCGTNEQCSWNGAAVTCACPAPFYREGTQCVPKPAKLLATGSLTIALSTCSGSANWNHGFEYALEMLKGAGDTYSVTKTQGDLSFNATVTVTNFATKTFTLEQTATYSVNYMKNGNTTCPAGTGVYTFKDRLAGLTNGKTMPAASVPFKVFGVSKPLYYSESANVSSGTHTYSSAAGGLSIDRGCGVQADCPAGTTCQTKSGTGTTSTFCLP